MEGQRRTEGEKSERYGGMGQRGRDERTREMSERETWEWERGKDMLKQKAWLQPNVSLFAKSRQGSWVVRVGWSVMYSFLFTVWCLTGSWDRPQTNLGTLASIFQTQQVYEEGQERDLSLRERKQTPPGTNLQEKHSICREQHLRIGKHTSICTYVHA